MATKLTLLEKANLRGELAKKSIARSLLRVRCLHEDKNCNIGKLGSIRESYLESANLRRKAGAPKLALARKIKRVEKELALQHYVAAKRMADAYLRANDRTLLHSLEEVAMHLKKAEEYDSEFVGSWVKDFRQFRSSDIIILGMGHLVSAINCVENQHSPMLPHAELALGIFRNALLIDPSQKIELDLRLMDLERRWSGMEICRKIRTELGISQIFHQP